MQQLISFTIPYVYPCVYSYNIDCGMFACIRACVCSKGLKQLVLSVVSLTPSLGPFCTRRAILAISKQLTTMILLWRNHTNLFIPLAINCIPDYCIQKVIKGEDLLTIILANQCMRYEITLVAITTNNYNFIVQRSMVKFVAKKAISYPSKKILS